MDSKNIEELNAIEPVAECCNAPVTDECRNVEQAINPCDCETALPVTDEVKPEQQAEVAGTPVDPNAPVQVFLEWGFVNELSCFAMLVKLPNSGNFQINFSLEEIRGLRDNVIKLIDANTKQ